jgi:hypothetical protein
MNRTLSTCLMVVAALCGAFAAQADVIGLVKNVVPSTIWVSPNGDHVICVTVNPQTKKRQVNLDGHLLPGTYDAIAEGTPFFSADGKHHAFVATRGGKCMVVIDGVEQPTYDIIKDRWPITGLMFGADGDKTHVAYQVTVKDKHSVVVNGRKLGAYASIKGGLPGIWDFYFKGSYFAYRAKVGDRMVACRGDIDGRGRVRLKQSRQYLSVGSGSPVWMGGASNKNRGLFAFIAKDAPGKERILTLPGDKPITKKTWNFIARNMLQTSSAKKGEMVYVAGENKQWHVVVGDKEWPACQTLGRLLSSPSGKTWASTAKVDGKLVMMVNGVASQAYAEIQHAESLFPAGDERVVFAATTPTDSKTPARVIVDGKAGKAYAQVRGDSILFSPDKTAMAYVAGDGNKNFLVVDGVEGAAFDGVDDLRFSSKSVSAYRARRGAEYFVVVGDKTWGPYADVKPRSLVFSPDGKTAAWAVFGKDGNWLVLANGKPIDSGCDRVISQLTFAPGTSVPAYVGRFITAGKTAFALSFNGKFGREYRSIWMGDYGKLFVREDGSISYFAKSGALLYRVVAEAK